MKKHEKKFAKFKRVRNEKNIQKKFHINDVHTTMEVKVNIIYVYRQTQKEVEDC